MRSIVVGTQRRVLLCILFLINIVLFYGRSVEWLPDDISLVYSQNLKRGNAVFNVSVNANGELFEDLSSGHFQLKYTFLYQNRLEVSGKSECISFTGDSSKTAKGKLVNSALTTDDSVLSSQLFGKYYSVIVQKFFNNYNGTSNSTTSFMFTVAKKITNTTDLIFETSIVNCTALQTRGYWDDAVRWSGKTVPSSTDEVVIPSKSGVILVRENVEVASMSIYGGVVRAFDSGCPPMWTMDDRTDITDKCYKFVDLQLSFPDATKYCNNEIGKGSIRRNLVEVSDREELDLVYRLCRSSKNIGCWVDLQDGDGTGKFRWNVDSKFANSNVPKLFFDWRRFEPNNHTVSLGKESVGGERCVGTIPWIEDPLLEEQGGWNDDSCSTLKSFVCQSVAISRKYHITITGKFSASGGRLEGGIVVIGTQPAVVESFSLSRSAKVVVPSTSNLTISNLNLVDGAKIQCDGNVQILNGYVGELTPFGAQPVVVFGRTSSLRSRGSASIAAKFLASGNITIEIGAELQMLQGGVFSQASLNLLGATSKFTLAGYSSRMATWDSFELVVSHRGVLVGEFYGNNVQAENANEHSMTYKGVYRLKVTTSTDSEISACIPYNATATALRDILNQVSIIEDRGGVTVRGYGDMHDQMFSYGYTYRIEMDAPNTNHYLAGPVNIDYYCYGLSCGCAETKVEIVDPTGTSLCPNPSNYSNIEADSCVIAPTIGVQRITTLSFIQTTGNGVIEILGGSHRLMPISHVAVVLKSGSGIVSASNIMWYSFKVSQTGNLIIAGTGWSGWDSSYMLFAPEWLDERGIVSKLLRAPPANMSCIYFNVMDSGRVVTTGPNTTMVWSSGEWNGGIIGGLSDLYIVESINLAGDNKALRYGITVHISDSATATWSNGDISLANGAKVLVRGIFNVTNSNDKIVTIGEAHLLSSTDGLDLLRAEAGRSWQSYFDNRTPAELRSAWYLNPLCGDRCLLINELNIEGNGQIIADSQSSSRFLLPLNIVGTSRFNVGLNANVNLGSGGIFGNDVVVDLSLGTTLELSGGRMKMEATCTIQGSGELIVTAGSHDLSFSVDAHITISGGTLLWPESRGTQKTITFNGGLLIQGTGQLEVQPFSTTVLVHNEVHLKDQSIIQFPLIGIAAQASPFDRSDAPDSSPRGNLTATGTLRWEGGTLKGKADFNALKELFFDGDVKYIKSLAKLVNKGHCEWANGDIITSDNGDFQNFGTIQMRDGVSSFSSSAMYKGSELPLENGGDFFALEFHSWDTDNGALDYTEYLQLRTRFVSRAPNGWTFESQK